MLQHTDRVKAESASSTGPRPNRNQALPPAEGHTFPAALETVRRMFVRLVGSRVRGRFDADDVLQEIYLSLLLGAEDSNPTEPAPEATLDAGVVARVADGVLRNMIKSELGAAKDARLEAAAGLEAATSVEVEDLLTVLPLALRNLFADHALRGLTYRELSKKTGLPRATIGRRIREARDLLTDPALGLVLPGGSVSATVH
jgi:DNA-directed RNA polymerase specialized sigma24 family protein